MSSAAVAEEFIPYSTRTQSFSGWTTFVQGDVRTVAMAGASQGLADTFISAIENPAGLAMTLNVGDIHYSSNFIRDEHVQNFDAGLQTQSAGLALCIYPWAVSAGYLSDYREDAVYTLPLLSTNPAHLTIATRRLVLSAARGFFHDRLSIGATLVLAQAVRSMEFATPRNNDDSYSSFTAGANFGAIVQLPKRFLIGASFSLPMHFATNDKALGSTPELPGLFQAVDVPWRVGIGLGFIPNRFLRADVSLHLVGKTDHAALLRDEKFLVGQELTLQPRLGVAYVFADYRELKGTLFLGTYYESTRISGTDSRFHGTGGLEAKVWIFTAGGGMDFADHYRNLLFSFGVDVFDVLARLDMITTTWSPPHQGMFPRPYVLSDAGLARPLVKDWKPKGPQIDPIKAALALPSKVEPGLRKAETDLKVIGKDVADFFTPPAATPTTPATPTTTTTTTTITTTPTTTTTTTKSTTTTTTTKPTTPENPKNVPQTP